MNVYLIIKRTGTNNEIYTVEFDERKAKVIARRINGRVIRVKGKEINIYNKSMEGIL